MSGIINISASQNAIDFCAKYLFEAKGKICCISGGRRPSFFIKKKLAALHKKSFYPPDFFTNPLYIQKVFFEKSNISQISNLQAEFILYEIIKTLDKDKQIIKENTTFAKGLGWVREVRNFIEELDLEDVGEKSLLNIKANADIKYDVPQEINNLLIKTNEIRHSFHDFLEKNNLATNSFAFLKCKDKTVRELSLDYDEIILLAPFYMYKTEIEIFKKLMDAKKLTIIISGNPNEYLALRKIYENFNQPIAQMPKEEIKKDFNIYSAYDDQSQAVLVKNLIAKNELLNDQLDETLIVTPDENIVMPLIAELTSITDNFNVSLGYPIHITAIFSILESIFASLISKRQKAYYVRDIMKVLTNPFVKNMRFLGDEPISRIIAHKIQDAFGSNSQSQISGKLFVELQEMISDKDLIDEISKTVKAAKQNLDKDQCQKVLEEIFNVFFADWQNIETLAQLCDCAVNFIEKILRLSIVGRHSLNALACQAILDYAKEIKNFKILSNQKFLQEDLLNIFLEGIKDKRLHTFGSPFEGLQVLGLLESRNLSFKNIYILSMTESNIPKISKDQSFIPAEIMQALGISRIEADFEIQKYMFERLIAGAKNINLIYPENEDEPKSRFLEKIIWQKQLEAQKLDSVQIKRFDLAINPSTFNAEKKKYKKTKEIKDFLKGLNYSHSSIASYLDCRLKFYFSYVLGLKEQEMPGEEFGLPALGTFLHDYLKDMFCKGTKKQEILSDAFKDKYSSELNKRFNSFEALAAREDAFLMKELIKYKMESFLNTQRDRDFVEVFDCEQSFAANISAKTGVYKIKCKIDRIDIDEKGSFILIDYKSG
ncbi:MAG: PD-(D/E)XK nuclease family protein, partial [Elusimicrobiota bacterium]|nr:PD-(D/E)XK nuclease family protein [Elusimicrobiota bacterium]